MESEWVEGELMKIDLRLKYITHNSTFSGIKVYHAI